MGFWKFPWRSGLLALAFCLAGAAQAQPVRVGSKIDTEGSLLGNLIVQVLEAGGIKTENKLSARQHEDRARRDGGRRDRPLSGVHRQRRVLLRRRKEPGVEERQGGLREVKSLDSEKNKLVWLAPAPANNTWAIAVRKDVATAQKLKSLADFGKYVAGGGKVKLAASAEFVERPDALPAFQTAYGFKLGAGPVADAGRRRHGGHDQGRGRADVGRQRARWPTAPTARWPRSGS